MSELVYLASPYSDENPSVREHRFRLAAVAAGDLMKQGFLVFSPIAHTHPIAEYCELPTGWDFWERYDKAMLDACAEMIVLVTDGWGQSKGVAAEMAHFEQQGKPIRFIRLRDGKAIFIAPLSGKEPT